MNLLGLSFGMGARDVGMQAAVSSAQKNLNKLNDSLEEQSRIAGKAKTPGLFEKLRGKVRDFNIASIADNVQALTGDTGNLSNSLESMMVGYAKAVKPIVAGMNLTGAEAQKMTSRISGMAYGMGVGAETVAEVFKTLQRATGPAKEALDAFGLSAKTWVKVAETTGLKVEDLTDVTGGIGALFKVSAKDGAQFVNSMVELGKVTGLGMAPLKNLKGQTEEIGAIFEKMPPGLQRTGEEMMGLIQSATRMSGVFVQMGSSEDEAVKMGGDVAKMFAEQSVSIQRAMALGMGEGDLAEASPILKYLTGLGIGFEEARSIVDVGSRDTVKGMQAIQGAFQKYNVSGAQQQAMLSGLSEALGSSAAGLGYLAQSGDTGAKAMERVNKVALTGKFGLQQYADQAFSTGRTLQDEFNMAKEVFDTKIRAIARADVRALVGAKVGALNEVATEIQALGSDKTWGPLVKGMSLFKQMGMQGLLLQLGKTMGMDAKAAAKMSTKFNMGFDTLKEFGKELGPVMSLLGKFGPTGIAAGGIVGFFMLSDAERSKIWETIKPIWEKVKVALKGAWESFQSWWAKTDFSSVKAGFTGLVQTIIPIAKDIAKGLIDVIVDTIGSEGVLIAGALGIFFSGGGFVGALAGGIAAATYMGMKSAQKDFEEYLAGREKKKQEDAANRAKLQEQAASELAYAGMQQGMKGRMTVEEQRIQATGGGSVDYAAALTGTSAQESMGKAVVATGLVRQAERDKELREMTRKSFKGTAIGAIPVVGDLMADAFEFFDAREQQAAMLTTAAAKLEQVSTGEMTSEQQKLMDQLAAIQHLPQVQQQLAGAMKLGPLQFVAAAKEMVDTYYQQVTEMEIADVETAIDTTQARMATLADTANVTLSNMLQQQAGVLEQGAYTAGATMTQQQGLGILENTDYLEEQALMAAQSVADRMVMQSPIAEGPLAGVGVGGESDPSYRAGRTMMEMFAAGITDSTSAVAEAVTYLLDQSVIGTFDAYQTKMEEVNSRFNLLQSVAGDILESLGSDKVKMSVDVGGVQENLKENMKALISLPGMAGITLAILQEGAKARSLLTKIADNTTVLAGGKAPTKPGTQLELAP